MFKLDANIFRFKESTLSRANLKRLWLFAIVSLPFIPLMLLLRLNVSDDIPALKSLESALDGWVGYSVFVVSFIAMVSLFLSRVANRFWVHDRHLDEWEIEIKRKSMTFALKVILVFWAVALLISLFLRAISVMDEINLSIEPLSPVRLSLETVSLLVVFISLYAQIFYVLTALRVIEDEGSSPEHASKTMPI